MDYIINSSGIELPLCVLKGSQQIYGKADILNYFNEHFRASGTLFDTLNGSR